jgi:hypothetical protein
MPSLASGFRWLAAVQSMTQSQPAASLLDQRNDAPPESHEKHENASEQARCSDLQRRLLPLLAGSNTCMRFVSGEASSHLMTTVARTLTVSRTRSPLSYRNQESHMTPTMRCVRSQTRQDVRSDPRWGSLLALPDVVPYAYAVCSCGAQSLNLMHWRVRGNVANGRSSGSLAEA